jgi:LPS-assembly protein
MQYDAITADAFGVGYLDDCFGFNLGIGQSYNVLSNERRTNVSFNISFRTIGDFGSNTGKMFPQQN